MPRQLKSEQIHVMVTPDDKAEFLKAAEREGMTISELMRASTLLYLATRMNGHALRAALRGGMELLKEFEHEGRSQFFAKKVKA